MIEVIPLRLTSQPLPRIAMHIIQPTRSGHEDSKHFPAPIEYGTRADLVGSFENSYCFVSIDECPAIVAQANRTRRITNRYVMASIPNPKPALALASLACESTCPQTIGQARPTSRQHGQYWQLLKDIIEWSPGGPWDLRVDKIGAEGLLHGAPSAPR